MSLIAKIQQQSLLQNKLQAQLAEMSYQAVNGTRQAPRNFREGTLEIGKMHFTTPQDRITKEMVMDYQQKEQEKHYTDSAGNKLKYEPTGLRDVIKTVTPIINGPITTGPSTENDLRTYKDAYLQLHYDLDVLKEQAQIKNVEIDNQETDILENEKDIDDKNAEYTVTQAHWRKLNTELTKVQAALTALAAASSSSSSTGTVATPTKITQVKKKEKDLEDDILTVDANLLTIQADLVALQNELITRKADLTVVKGEYTNIINDTKAKEKEITDKETEIGQINKNIIENKEEIQKVNNLNKDITRKYTDTFNMANRDRYSVQQDPNEDDQAYLNRIKVIESAQYDPKIFKEKAANEGNLKLMTNLRNSLRDEVKISEIVKSFVAEEVFIINTNWSAIQEQLKVKFGINNPIKTVNDYVTEIRDIIDTLQNKQYGTTLLPASAAASTTLANAASPLGSSPQDHTDGTASDFIWKHEKNSLYIGNTSNGKGIWVKIGNKNRDFIMFSNTTNAEKEFRAFKYILTGNFSFKRIMEILDLNNDADIRLQFFGPYGRGHTVQDMFNHLKTVIGLNIETGKKFKEGTEEMYGWGLNKEVITKHANFGKNIILLDKLYYKNTLSIKDKKMHSIEHLPNVKVSDTLADIIVNMCKNEHPTKQTLDTLNSDEKKLFDILLYVSGLRKSKHVNKVENASAKDANIKELKQRFKITEAEIQAGNNNPVVKAELKEIINKLVLYHVISQNNGKKYLQQF